jgi:hypothetical protein
MRDEGAAGKGVAMKDEQRVIRFEDLPIGAHYRIVSAFDPGVVLPAVRVKVGESHYRMLHPSRSINRHAALATIVVPVTDDEKKGGARPKPARLGVGWAGEPHECECSGPDDSCPACSELE